MQESGELSAHVTEHAQCGLGQEVVVAVLTSRTPTLCALPVLQ